MDDLSAELRIQAVKDAEIARLTARLAAVERVARRAYCDLGVLGAFLKEIDALDIRAGFYIKEHIEPVRNELLALRFAALDGKEDADG